MKYDRRRLDVPPVSNETQMNLTHEIAIDKIINRTEVLTGLHLPKENSKNYYLKACWLIANLQRVRDSFSKFTTPPESKPKISLLIQEIESLNSMLSVFREECRHV